MKIKTPHGIGNYVDYDSDSKMVTVEMDNSYLVEYEAKETEVCHEPENL